eukprot:551156-Rhodomonas_salina.1
MACTRPVTLRPPAAPRMPVSLSTKRKIRQTYSTASFLSTPSFSFKMMIEQTPRSRALEAGLA